MLELIIGSEVRLNHLIFQPVRPLMDMSDYMDQGFQLLHIAACFRTLSS